MTIEQFRRHKFLPGQWARELATNGILRAVLQLMEDNAPWHYTVIPDRNGDISPTRDKLEMDLARGYAKYGDTLKLIARSLPHTMDPGPSTYEAPEQLKKDLTHG